MPSKHHRKSKPSSSSSPPGYAYVTQGRSGAYFRTDAQFTGRNKLSVTQSECTASGHVITSGGTMSSHRTMSTGEFAVQHANDMMRSGFHDLTHQGQGEVVESPVESPSSGSGSVGSPSSALAIAASWMEGWGKKTDAKKGGKK